MDIFYSRSAFNQKSKSKYENTVKFVNVRKHELSVDLFCQLRRLPLPRMVRIWIRIGLSRPLMVMSWWFVRFSSSNVTNYTVSQRILVCQTPKDHLKLTLETLSLILDRNHWTLVQALVMVRI